MPSNISPRHSGSLHKNYTGGSTSSATSSKPTHQILPYTLLKNRPNQSENPFPPGVDIHNREQYLSEEEFEDIFKMTKTNFNRLTKWRKQELKKRYNLF